MYAIETENLSKRYGDFYALNGVYYPITIFPEPLRLLSLFIPLTHVIISLRSIMLAGVLDLGEMATGLCLSSVYAFLAYRYFERSMRESLMSGMLGNW